MRPVSSTPHGCWRALTLVGALSFLASCAGGSLAGSAEHRGAPRWSVRLLPGGDVDVGGIDTVLCFDGKAPARVVPEHPGAAPYLMDMPLALDAAGGILGPLPVDERGIDTAKLPAGACVAFVVDVEAAAKAFDSQALAEVVDRSLLLSPDVWLWRPDPWPADVAAGTLVVDSPPAGDEQGDLQLAVPFPIDKAKKAYVVAASTFALQSWSAVGRLRERTTVVARKGTTLTISALGDVGDGIDAATLNAWLEVAIDDVAAVSGRFPVDHVRVLVLPRAGTRAVLGGFLGRGGGASALFHVGTGPLKQEDDPELIDDDGRWVLTHELAHALLPPVRRGDAWLNEGLTTWQQERLPVLAGRRPAATATAQLAIGLRTGHHRAVADGLSLERACAEMDERRSHQHCYWGGAALAVVLANDVGDDGVFALIRALGATAAFDASAQPALTLLQAVSSSPAADPLARRAASALATLWRQHKNAPFPVDEHGVVRAAGFDSAGFDAADTVSVPVDQQDPP